MRELCQVTKRYQDIATIKKSIFFPETCNEKK